MKSLVLGLLLFLFSCPAVARAQGEGRGSDAERAGLSGRVKSVETWRVEYTLKEGHAVEGRRVPFFKTTYDEQGRKAEEVRYGDDGSPSARNVYTYDAEGRATGYEEYSGILD